MPRELDFLAALVHGAAAASHLRGAVRGQVPREHAGAAVTLHVLGLAYNARREQWLDAAAHLFAIAITSRRSRFAHLAIAAYDTAAALQHARATRRERS